MPKLPDACNDMPKIQISALHDLGIKQLREKIVYLCVRDLTMEDSAVIPNLRHKNALVQTLGFLASAKENIKNREPEETLAIDLKNSIDSLGTITGETASVDILDTIFNNFCIGK
jgi:tRNA modification GTPase